ncbi:RNA-binding domain-containing protein [Wallemia mellicola]|nr:RNA-binding domain-containing protein [Wallemia mellicola]
MERLFRCSPSTKILAAFVITTKMSRLIVKGLPTTADNNALRTHFGSRGATITDAKVVFKKGTAVGTSKGKSRGFGFVGFKSPEEAKEALHFFNKTYWGTSKLEIEIVEDNKSIQEQLQDGKALKAKRRRKEGKESDSEEEESNKRVKVLKPVHLKAIEMQKAKNKAAKSSDSEQEGGDDNTEMSDLEYMRAKMKRRHIPEETDEAPKEETPQETTQDAEARKQAEVIDQVMETARIFLRNLPFSCTEDDLKTEFSKYGVVNQAHVPLSNDSKTPMGVAYISFASPNAAVAAFRAADGSIFQGRLLHVLPAVNKRPPQDLSKASFKKLRNKDRKEGAESREFSWSGLYMNADAVVSSLAARLNVEKAEILSSDSSSNPAVKVALAETHVINETKGFLKEQGVNLDAFSPENRGPRLENTLLIKNIPFGTSVDDLDEMFRPCGEISRLLLPPAGTIAIIEYLLPNDARTAFKKLAYKRVGNSVLYLEKAPNGMWAKDAPSGAIAAGGPKPVEVVDKETPTDKVAAGEEEAASTLFIKNIAFSTPEAKLASIFSSLSGYRYARIQTKPDPKSAANRLSMGYGFVGFDNEEHAKDALASMQKYVLDGHSLQVKFAQRGKDSEPGAAMGQTKTTKMLVKNVPFEASKKDIRELFGMHGQLKSVRLPRKFDRKTRGFAFLDFVTRRDAEIAYESLKHTHLLGRHLVLQWADDAAINDIDALREKTASSRSTNMPTNKTKFVGPEGLALEELNMTLPQYKLSATLEGHTDDVKSVFACKDNSILSASRDGTVRRFAGDNYDLKGTYLGHMGYVNSVHYMEGGSDSRILIHDKGRAEKPLESLLEHWNNVCCLDTRGNTIASGSWDLTARVWNVAGGHYEQVSKLDKHDAAVWDVKLLPDGSLLTASADNFIRHFNPDGSLNRRFEGHTEPVRALAILDGTSFFSASNDGTIRKWNLKTGEQIAVLPGHSSFIYSLAILSSPDGEDYLVSCGEDYEVRVWLGETCLQSILIPAVSIWSVSVLPNGDFAVGTSQNLIHVFTTTEERKANLNILEEWDAQTNEIKDRQTGRSATNKKATEISPIVIDIDVDDDKPNLQLTYNVGEDVQEVAEKFVQANDLSENYIQRIAQFLAQATGQPEVQKSVKEEPKAEKTPIKRLAEILTSNETKKVIIMAGAGVSTSAGLPDFRSPNTGLYANLQQYNLPYPEAVFDIDFFREQPKPFYALAKELYPGSFLPTITHYFFKLLENKGLLKRVFTQNIDTLERVAGVSDDLMVEAHGSFAKARCVSCKELSDGEYVKSCVMRSEIPVCQEVGCADDKNAFVKPDITFFGEALPRNFFDKLDDFNHCDLLIVLGTSLKVNPFASLISFVGGDTPRALLNLEQAGVYEGGGFSFDEGSRDIFCKGKVDDVVVNLAEECGWKGELMELYETERQEKAKEFNLIDSLTEDLSKIKM